MHPGSTELHDSPERIKSRLAIYKDGEKNVLEFYRQKGVLFEINADRSIEEVHTEILSHAK